MKHFFIILFSISFVLVNAQEDPPAFDAIDYTKYRNHFYFNPISPLLNSFEVGFERMDKNFNNSFAVFTGIAIRDQINSFASLDQQYLALKLNAQYRFGIFNEPSARIKRGGERITQQNLFIYISPYATIKYGEDVSRSDNLIPDPNNPNGPFISQSVTTKQQGTAFGGGALFGGRWTMGKRFDMDLYLGGGVQYATTTKTPDFINGNGTIDLYRVYYTGIAPVVGYSLGISF